MTATAASRSGLIAEEELPGAAVAERRGAAPTTCAPPPGATTPPARARSAPRDAGGVLDSDFRGARRRGLRVVDASVFPRIPGFFIASAVYMVGREGRRRRSCAAAAPAQAAEPATTHLTAGNREESTMAYDVEQLLDDVADRARRPVPRQPGRADSRTARPRDGDHRAGHQLQPGDRRVHQPFRLAGQGVRRREGRAAEPHPAVRPRRRSSPRSTRAPSWLDSKECIVLDYSETSLVAHWIRDEIRQIAPGLLSRQGVLGQGSG